MPDLTIRQGDTKPAFAKTLGVDITGATSVTFTMRAQTAAAAIVTGACTVDTASTGAVHYAWQAADTATAGLYSATIRVVFADASTQTFPTTGAYDISVEENLTTAGGARILSLSEVKDHLLISAANTDHDAKLLRFIDGITKVVESLTGDVLQQQVTEFYRGGVARLILRHRPVLSVQNVIEWRGPVAYELAQVATPDLGTMWSYTFEADQGTITRRIAGGGTSYFPDAPEAVQISYTSGVMQVPYNVRLGALELLKDNYDSSQEIGRPAFGTAGAQDDIAAMQTGSWFVSPRVRQLLGADRRPPSVV